MKNLRTLITLGVVVIMVIGVVMAENNYEQQSVSVGLTSKLIVPAADPNTTNRWIASTAFSYGDYIRVFTNNMSRYFWCTTAGTSSNTTPVWVYTNDTIEASGVVWRSIDQNRGSVYIGNDNAGALYLGWGRAAEANKGYRINALGGSLIDSDDGVKDGEIYGISPAGVTNDVLTQILP